MRRVASICMMAPVFFSKRTRKYTYALPGPWLWADDVPARHALYRPGAQQHEATGKRGLQLDRPLKRQRPQTAAKRMAAEAGADTCTSNAVHMGRVPGGYNCKRRGKFLVCVEQHTERIYSADLLLSRHRLPQIAARGTARSPHWTCHRSSSI